MSFEDVKLFRIENGAILKAVSDSYGSLITYFVNEESDLDALS